MSERNNGALAVEEAGSALLLEQQNRELASQQVRQINDTLRKVRKISRESQQHLPVVTDEMLSESSSFPMVVEEISSPRHLRDSRRERDDSTDKFLIPEPTLETSVGDLFLRAFELFERECAQFQFTRGKNSPVIRTWKLL